MDLRRQISVARRWLILFVVAMGVGGVAGYVGSSLEKPVYEARTTVLVGQSLSAANPDYNQILASQRLSATYAAVATTRPILDAVSRELKLGLSADDLAKRVRAEAPTDSILLTIAAQDGDPARAAAIANAISAQLVAASPAIEGRLADVQKTVDSNLESLATQITTTQAQADALLKLPTRTAKQESDLDTLEARVVSLRASYAALLPYSSASSTNLLSVVEPAVAPTTPASPRPLLYALLGALLGLLLSVGFVSVYEYLDDSVKDPATVEEVCGLITLGRIPRLGRRAPNRIYDLDTLLHPRSAFAEAFRTVQTNIGFASVDKPIRSLLVTSARPREGKTAVASNLAVVFAQAGKRVLLVDADLRWPGVHLLFGIENGAGLTTLLGRNDTLEAVVQETEVPNLTVLTAGAQPANPVQLLDSERMRRLCETLATEADLVIFDCGPLQAVTDAAILSSYLDGTILVVHAGRTGRTALRQSRDALKRAGANVIGAVLDGARQTDEDYYGSYYQPEPAPAAAAAAVGPSTGPRMASVRRDMGATETGFRRSHPRR